MTIYNVKISIVELVDADSPAKAMDKLRTRVHQAGLETCDEDLRDIFVSEDQSFDGAL